MVAVLLAIIAIPVSAYRAQAFSGHDDPRIVTDELLTYPLATLALPIRRHPVLLVGVFATSRILDSIKPFPARAVESWPGLWTLLLWSVGWRWYLRCREKRSAPQRRE